MRTERRARDRLNQARLCGAAALVFLLSVGASVFAAVALAAPPANDDFANAAPLSGPFPIVARGTTSEATQEPGEPEDQYSQSVWYVWTAPSSGPVAIDTCGGAPITLVYRGSSLSDLQAVNSRDEDERRSVCPLPDPDIDHPGDIHRVTEFTATAGATYRIQVLGVRVDGAFGLVLKEPEVYDLGVSLTVSRRTVPFGGALREVFKVTNRGNIVAPTPQDPRIVFGQEINVPGRPHYPGKAVYASARSPGGRCSHGIFGGGSKIQVFACDVVRLSPGESQTAVVKIRKVKGSLLLDGHVSGQAPDDRRGNDDAQTVIRVRR